MRIKLVDGIYSDQAVREGEFLQVTKATNYPVEVRFDDGQIGYLNVGDFDLVADVILPVASDRPGDQAAEYAAEAGVSYERALVACNMD